MSTVIHRVKQFLRALRARVENHELLMLSEYLAPAQRALFFGMAVSDQRHSLDLFYVLRERGETDEALLQAALLHDVGKSQTRVALWQRVSYVLLGVIAPRWMERLGRSARRDWRYGFFVLTHHTELGAEMARRAGCAEEVVALIRNHQRPITSQLALPVPSQRKLQALQAADND